MAAVRGRLGPRSARLGCPRALGARRPRPTSRSRPTCRSRPTPIDTDSLDDDAFFASLREAVRDDAPLGPRDDEQASFYETSPSRTVGGSAGAADASALHPLQIHRHRLAVDVDARRHRRRPPAPPRGRRPAPRGRSSRGAGGRRLRPDRSHRGAPGRDRRCRAPWPCAARSGAGSGRGRCPRRVARRRRSCRWRPRTRPPARARAPRATRRAPRRRPGRGVRSSRRRARGRSHRRAVERALGHGDRRPRPARPSPAAPACRAFGPRVRKFGCSRSSRRPSRSVTASSCFTLSASATSAATASENAPPSGSSTSARRSGWRTFSLASLRADRPSDTTVRARSISASSASSRAAASTSGQSVRWTDSPDALQVAVELVGHERRERRQEARDGGEASCRVACGGRVVRPARSGGGSGARTSWRGRRRSARAPARRAARRSRRGPR